VRALPGVKSAAIADDKPFGVMNNPTTSVTIEGYQMPPNQQSIEVRSSDIGNGYFATLDIPIIRGRAFDDRDRANSPRTVIVNETMAQRFWPDRDPIGMSLDIKEEGGGPAEVIGIARNAKYADVNERAVPFLYRSYEQSSDSGAVLLVQTDGPPGDLTAAIRTEVRNIAPNVPIFDIRSMGDHYREYGLLEPRIKDARSRLLPRRSDRRHDQFKRCLRLFPRMGDGVTSGTGRGWTFDVRGGREVGAQNRKPQTVSGSFGNRSRRQDAYRKLTAG
jgi:hypothetical protein